MKKIIKTLIFASVMIWAINGAAQQTVSVRHRKSENQHKVGDLNAKRAQPEVKNRSQRMAMQLRQVKYHDKQVKKAEHTQREVSKEQRQLH
jgi:hypothetical protein